MASPKKKRKGPTPKKVRVRLAVIPEPDPGTRSIIEYAGKGTVALKGPGRSPIMECGSCGAPQTEGVKVSQLRDLVFRCNRCGAFNETLN